MRADERHDHLEDGHHEGQDQGEMSEFNDHGPYSRADGWRGQVVAAAWRIGFHYIVTAR
jgi:hypothetical protein